MDPYSPGTRIPAAASIPKRITGTGEDELTVITYLALPLEVRRKERLEPIDRAPWAARPDMTVHAVRSRSWDSAEPSGSCSQ